MLDRDAAGATGAAEALKELRERMSRQGAQIRDPKTIGRETAKAWRQLARLKKTLRAESAGELAGAFKALDLCLTQAVYLEAIKEYLVRGGASRGSTLVLDPAGAAPCPGLGDEWKFMLAAPGTVVHDGIMEIAVDGKGGIKAEWTAVRPIPEDDAWFENVWDDFRNDRVIR
jgi:hypothetical protein